MKKILHKIMILASFITLATPLMPLATVHGQLFDDSVDQACEGLTGGAGCDTAGADESVNSTLELIINIFSFIVGIVAVIMIVVGGLKYITSTGDSNSVNGAKNTILYAIIGLVVVALAQVIVRFVLGRVTN